MDKLDKARKNIDNIDKKMRELFLQRMEESKTIATYKMSNHLPILNKERENQIIINNSSFIDDLTLRKHYIEFLKSVMNISKKYQDNIFEENEQKDVLIVSTSIGFYPVYLLSGVLQNVSKLFNLNRKVLIVSDSGVPEQYISCLKEQCATPVIAILKKGEKAKSMKNYELLMKTLLAYEFTRSDCIVALGGGVCGDLAGFVASTYKRGLEFYNIPTTLLAQVDSSIGGKTAINHENIKNPIGTFYQPSGVLIDKTLLKTLKKRYLFEGLVEAFKMGIIKDKSLVDLILNSQDLYHDLDEIIKKSLIIKKDIVEEDEFENNTRQLLNYGHTFGHAIESLDSKFNHGESVGVGMLFVSSSTVKETITKFLKKYHLPTKTTISTELLIEKIHNDKKCSGDFINIVYVEEIAKPTIKKVKLTDLQGDKLCEMF